MFQQWCRSNNIVTKNKSYLRIGLKQGCLKDMKMKMNDQMFWFIKHVNLELVPQLKIV
jgi:hypothetical protein